MNTLSSLLIAQTPWWSLLGSTPVEVLATLCSVAGVFCIARQKVIGWPLGIIWAVLSAWLALFEWQLLSDALLYLSYIPIQAYCWYRWTRNSDSPSVFLPSWSSRRVQLVLILAASVGIVLWARGISLLSASISWLPVPALLWRDASSTVLNYFAQFLQAKKRMENWLVWLLVNGLGIHIYWVKGSPIYALQYAIFLGLAVYGWMAWQKSMEQGQTKQ